MTRADHPSGSDRIFEALAIMDPRRQARVIVNLQGDLPTLDPGDIAAAVALIDDPAVDVATLAAEIARAEERANPNVVKVVGSPVTPGRLRALYFTRATTASMRIGGKRWRNSSRCRRRRSSDVKSSSNCGCSKQVCESTWRS
jgi:3-deoxy-manno-octulosonate cytidylyltransferase (CMP-KDO synthetase)